MSTVNHLGHGHTENILFKHFLAGPLGPARTSVQNCFSVRIYVFEDISAAIAKANSLFLMFFYDTVTETKKVNFCPPFNINKFIGNFLDFQDNFNDDNDNELPFRTHYTS